MATLTIKNLPDEVYAALTEMAKRNHRSLNGEAIFRLESSLDRPDREAKALLLKSIRKEREKLTETGVRLTDKKLKEGKRHRI